MQKKDEILFCSLVNMKNNFLSRVFVCVYPVFIWSDIAKKYGKSGEFREKKRRGGLAIQGSLSIEGGGFKPYAHYGSL